MKIAEISIKRPTLVVVLFTILTLGGIFSYMQMGYELIPKFEVNVVSVTTIYPGASPSEVENTVTKYIEDAISTLENVKKIESKSFESLSLVMITLTEKADADLSLNDAQRKINAILKDLPDDVEPPSLSKFSLDDLPILSIGATADMDDATFYDLLDKKIQPILSRADGVAKVDLVGGQEREIQVQLKADKLQGYGISVPQVQQMILASNLDFPTGNVKTRENSVLIRLSGKYQDIEELRNLVISNDGGQIRLKDIADINDTQKEADKIARIDRRGAILMQVLKQTDANAVAVSEDIHQMTMQLMEDYKANGLVLDIIDDTTEFTLSAANSVIKDLFVAILLVAFVCLFFLHSFRNALIVMLTIPISLIATFIGIFLLGYTLNLMSLLGLSLVVGILVDDAIVVIENIHRHLEMGKNRVRAAYDGTKEIGFTVMAITLVIVVVFLPIALSSGLVSNIIAQFCMTVVIATLLSLLASFTIVPWLSSRYGRIETITNKTAFGRIILRFEKGLDNFTHWITSILNWSLNNKIATLLIVTVLFFGTIFGLFGGKFIGFEFFASIDKGEFMVQMELPKDAALEQSNYVTQQAEDFLMKQPEVVQIISTVGQSSDGWGGAQGSAYKSEIKVVLTDKADRDDNTSIYAAKLKRELQKVLVGVKVKTVPVGMFGADAAPIMLTVTGPELDNVMEFAEEAAAELRKISGATEVKLTSEAGNPEINVQVDRDKMASLGLDLMTVGMTMQTAFSGNTDGKFRAGDYEYDINIRYNEFDRSNINDVRNLLFINNKGENIRLSQFATVSESSGPSLLERRDKSPSVNIEAQAIGRPSGTIAEEWEAIFSTMERPAGVHYVWGGDMENQTEGFGTLGYALLAAIILVYLVMVALYDSYITPFVVLFSVPLSFIGAALALALTNNSLNVFTILGIIMLIGLVAKNAILLVDFANQRKKEGESTHDALVQANHARLRPILMTTFAMVFGMLPIAMATGAAAEMNNGLAWVVIAGLISSLFLTLVIVPVVYAIFDSIVTRVTGNKAAPDFDALFVETYEPTALSDDGFTPKH